MWTIAVVILLSFTTIVHAEVRTYLQASTGVLTKSAHKLDLFVKEENRYRESGLVLNKLFIGVKPTILPWLSSQLYYANKDLDYTRHQNKHMLVGDIILSTRMGPFAVKDRSGNEWHITDHFYRYRNYFEMGWRTPVRWLSLWSSEELRFDSDQSRVNMNDVRLGISLRWQKGLNSRIFFDLDSNRRNTDEWHQKPFLGIEMTTAL